jgi:hypothetical protein
MVFLKVMTFRGCVEVCLAVRLRKVDNLVEPVLLIGHFAAVLGAVSTSASLIFKQFHLNYHFPLQTWLTY